MLAQTLGVADDIILAQQRQVRCGALRGRAQCIDAVRSAGAALVHEDHAVALQCLANKPRGCQRPGCWETRPALEVKQRGQALSAGRDDFAGIKPKSPVGIGIIPRDF